MTICEIYMYFVLRWSFCEMVFRVPMNLLLQNKSVPDLHLTPIDSNWIENLMVKHFPPPSKIPMSNTTLEKKNS